MTRPGRVIPPVKAAVSIVKVSDDGKAREREETNETPGNGNIGLRNGASLILVQTKSVSQKY